MNSFIQMLAWVGVTFIVIAAILAAGIALGLLPY